MFTISLQEALATLGLEAGVTKKEIRRAYLKLVKVHKPEQDPEGFQRVRLAYERAKGANDWEMEALAQQGAATSATESNESGAGSSEDPPKNDEQQALSPEEARATELDELHVRWDMAESTEKALEIAEEATRRFPEEERVRWLLYDSLLQTNQEDRAVEVLRRSVAEGKRHFLEELLRYSDKLRPEDIPDFRAMDEVSLFAIACAELGVGLVDDAAATFASAIAADIKTPGTPPNIYTTMKFLLKLAEQPGHHFAECFAVFRKWLVDSGMESSLYGSAATYALTDELAGLPSRFPHALRKAIATAISEGDPGNADPAIRAWYSVTQKKIARQALSQLREYAPLLHNAVGSAFTNAPRDIFKNERRVPQEEGALWSGLPLFIGAMLAVGVLMRCFNSSPPAHDYGVVGVYRPPSPSPAPAPPIEFHEAVAQVCGSADDAACSLAADVRRAVGNHDCDTAHMSMTQLLADAPDANSGDLSLSLEQACGPHDPSDALGTTSGGEGNAGAPSPGGVRFIDPPSTTDRNLGETP